MRKLQEVKEMNNPSDEEDDEFYSTNRVVAGDPEGTIPRFNDMGE